MSEKREFTPGGKSSYAHRKARRANGGAPTSRNPPPWWFNEVTKDFAQREREQEKVRLSSKKLSSNPNVPWGAERVREPLASQMIEEVEAA